MGKTILELFQTETLLGGTTAEQKYAIRDIKKDIETQSKNGILNVTAFKVQNLLRKKLSVKGKETRFEAETTGLNALMLLAGPGIYGTEYFRVKTKTTDSRDVMVESTKAGVGGNRGLLGGVLKFVKNAPKKFGTLLGIKFPEQMIPSRFVDRPEFKAGQSDLYDQIAKIKKASEGNGFGRFLQKNVSGTFEQAGNQVLSGALSAGKKAVETALFGSRKAGAVRLGSKPEGKRYYDVNSIYSDVVDEENTDVTLRTDLSTKFHVLRKLSKVDMFFPIFMQKFFAKRFDETRKNQNNKSISYVYQTPYLGESIYNYRNAINLIAFRKDDFLKSKKPGIVAIGNQMGITGPGFDFLETPLTDDGLPIPYTTTIDLDTPNTLINERNDLTTFLSSYIEYELGQPSRVSSRPKGVGVSDKGVPTNMGNYRPYSITNANPLTEGTKGYDLQRGILSYREISNGSDLMNLQGPMNSTSQTAKVGTLNKSLDEIDFISLKFGSYHGDRYAYFRGTVSGYSESYSPSYGQHQGIGMAYPLYTFESIERTLQFNFKAYSLNFNEHMANWERLQYLASLTMPQGFTANEATQPPLIYFWLGDMFVKRLAYIENLTYTTDVNFPWEIGLNSGSGADCYKLPMIIDVSVTIHFIEEMADTTEGKFIYDFWDANLKRTNNPAIADAIAAQNQPANIPTTTVVSSPKKKILPAATIPTLQSKPIKLADVNIPKGLPTIPNIQPLESLGNKIGGTTVDTNAPPEPKTSGESTTAPTTPTTPNVPANVKAITDTPTGATNSTRNTKNDTGVYEVITPYNSTKEFGDIIILGRATHWNDTTVSTFAKLNAMSEAWIRLGVPMDTATYNINAYDTGKDTHLYKNADGTFTFESKFRIQYLDKQKPRTTPLTEDEKRIERASKELDEKTEAMELKKWKSEN